MTPSYPSDPPADLLTSVQHEVARTNDRLDATCAHIASTYGRLDSLGEELSIALLASEMRTVAAVAELSSAIREMADVLGSPAA